MTGRVLRRRHRAWALAVVAAATLLGSTVVVASTATGAAGTDLPAGPRTAGVTTSGATPAVDDGDPATTTTAAPQVGGTTGDIIPRPGSGAAPQGAGDRGGAGQVAVFVAICAALAIIAALAYRDMRTRRGPR